MGTETEPVLIRGLRDYELGEHVMCTDGRAGTLERLVVDPVRRTVTHLVVAPHHRHALARLVPVMLARSADSRVHLRCTLAGFRALQHAEESDFLPIGEPWHPFAGSHEAVHYADAAMGFPGTGIVTWPYTATLRTLVHHESIPRDEVEIRRGDPVHTTSGSGGHVHGLVVDPTGEQVTHVLTQRGHLWGSQQVAIPIAAVSTIDGSGISVSLSREELRALPPLEVAAEWLEQGDDPG